VPAGASRGFADGGEDGGVRFVSTVREVQPDDVNAGRDERIDDRRRRARWPNRRDDLRVSAEWQESTSFSAIRYPLINALSNSDAGCGCRRGNARDGIAGRRARVLPRAARTTAFHFDRL
jgi:hypothetical protein